MKRIDGSPTGVFGVAWAPDGEWLTYLRGEDEVCLANVESGDIRVVGPGASPGLTADHGVVLERDDEILLVTADGERTLVDRKALVKDTPKRGPRVSPDGQRLLFTVCNVFDKESQNNNAYAYRHFMGVAGIDGRKPVLTGQQWYGGSAAWFPDSQMFAHYEFDSTGGARIHVVDTAGKLQGSMFGLYPAISPDGKHIACKARSGGTVVVYTGKQSWDKEGVETAVTKLPESEGRISASPPLWLDNRFVLIDEGGKLWRVDTRRDKCEELAKLPVPTLRGKHAMALNPDRDKLALEVPVEGGFELVIAPIG